jgi:hypothetical protein
MGLSMAVMHRTTEATDSLFCYPDIYYKKTSTLGEFAVRTHRRILWSGDTLQEEKYGYYTLAIPSRHLRQHLDDTRFAEDETPVCLAGQPVLPQYLPWILRVQILCDENDDVPSNVSISSGCTYIPTIRDVEDKHGTRTAYSVSRPHMPRPMFGISRQTTVHSLETKLKKAAVELIKGHVGTAGLYRQNLRRAAWAHERMKFHFGQTVDSLQDSYQTRFQTSLKYRTTLQQTKRRWREYLISGPPNFNSLQIPRSSIYFLLVGNNRVDQLWLEMAPGVRASKSEEEACTWQWTIHRFGVFGRSGHPEAAYLRWFMEWLGCWNTTNADTEVREPKRRRILME